MKYILHLFFIVSTFSVFSQTERILEIETYSNYNPNNRYKEYRFNNDNLLIIDKRWSGLIYRIVDLGTKKEIFNEKFDFEYYYTLNKAGLFYLKKRANAQYEYHYINSEGIETVSNSVLLWPENYLAPNSNLCASSELNFYYSSFENGKYCTYKTSGDTSSELKIFESTKKIVFLEQFNGNVLIVTYYGGIYEFHIYNELNNQLNTSLDSISSSLGYGLTVAGKNDNFIYLNLVNNSNKLIYEIDLENIGCQTFINDKLGTLTFINSNRFILKEDSLVTYENLYLIANIDSPNISKGLKIKGEGNRDYLLSQRLGNQHYVLGEFEKGFETAFVNEQDSIERISDLVPEYGTSYCIRNFSSSYMGHFLNTPYISLNDSIVLTIQTNGNDNYYYVYKTINGQQTSLFKIENPLRVTNFFLDRDNNELYWLVRDSIYQVDSMMLYKRNLNDLDLEQPNSKPLNEDSWFKQIAVSKNKQFFGHSNFLELKPKDVRSDKKGNTYTYSTFRYTVADYEGMSSFNLDNNSIVEMNSKHFFTKLDKHGNQKWTASIGERYHTSWFDYVFEIDSENNLIILGYYFETGYFDNDSLVSPRACYFITKLNGETGNVIWTKKIAETYYIDDIFIDELSLDKDDNIYLALMYPNFSVQIQDLTIESDVSRANGVAKFSSNGDVIWLKNINTPWLDYSGNSYVFNNNVDNTLTVCQTKATAKEQFIQTLDLDGNIIDTNSISTTGYSRLMVAMNNTNNQLFGLGYFQDDFEFERYKLNSPERKNFSFMYDYKKSEPISFEQGKLNEFYPLDIKSVDNEFYVYGTLRRNKYTQELMLLKFNDNGEFLAYKSIHQLIYSWDKVGFNSFDITNEHIVVMGSDFELNSDHGVVPLITSNRSLSVLKMKNENWIEDEDWFEQINTYLKPDESDVLIYPNPFTDEFDVMFSNYNVDYDSYKVFNLKGEILLEGHFSDIQFQSITFKNYAVGTYVIQFIGKDKVLNKKITKIQ